MKCPVCKSEYNEGQDTFCHVCKFPLRFHREDLQDLINWIKTIWMEKNPKDITSPSLSTSELQALQETIQKVNSLEELQSQCETEINKLKTQLIEKTQTVSYMNERLNKYQETSQSQLSKLNDKLLQNFETEKADSQQKLSDFEERLNFFEGLWETNQKISSHSSSKENSSVNQQTNTTENMSPSTHPKMEVNKEEYKLVQQFNANRKALGDLTEVSETEESFTTRRLGSNSSITFECKRRGTYLIIKNEGKDYLVPNDNFRINQNNLKHLEEVFEFWNYQPEKDFHLIKPALVTIQAGGKTWQLEKTGILDFNTTSRDQSS